MAAQLVSLRMKSLQESKAFKRDSMVSALN